ncbi:hypothetical protein P7C70_g150, partial [Phenoliferia sp. Uapishka_3]
MSDSISTDKGKDKEAEQPAGGFDDTPIPNKGDEPGWIIKITFHKALNLPIADYTSRSSDPYVIAVLSTDIPTRHPAEDPKMVLRTPTIQKSVNPVWECEWIVANIPSTGFSIKARIKDEDPDDIDDRLGRVHINVDHISDTEGGFKEKDFEIDSKRASMRAYAIRAMASALTNKDRHGHLIVSVEVLGKTEGEGGRVYTVGPMHWSRHYSPLVGKMAGTKEKDEAGVVRYKCVEPPYAWLRAPPQLNTSPNSFESNQIQLQGPVPAELYHRYVEFKKFVKGMFTNKGIGGKTLNHLLHHQHRRIYVYDKDTKYGRFDGPSEEVSKKFLEMVHHDEGGRLYTYVLLLDGLFRFTETGKEFGIDLLSKHTMHSDVAQYIACSGEFFIRRMRKPQETDKPIEEQDDTHPAESLPGGPPHEPAPIDPHLYELIIDNDSGTYRPNKDVMPRLGDFLQKNFVGLKVITMTCDDDKLQDMKAKQRELKKKEGDNHIYRQDSRSSAGSSLSSSDEEELEKKAQDESAFGEGEEETKKGFKKLGHALKNPKEGLMAFAASHS